MSLHSDATKSSISDPFNGKRILLTGGTGSFGKKFAKLTLDNFNPSQLIIFSRDEMKQWMMAQEFSDSRLKFIIGDVRDKDSVRKAMRGIDFVVHAAATKIVPLSELNAFECVKTNILGAMNVIDASIAENVSKTIALSTDKASAPVNLYGATKLASDKLFISANIDINNSDSVFSVVRYGNVMGSRGSIIPYFLSLKNSEEIPITDVRMTRFMITLEQAVDTVWHAFNDSFGGEIYVRKIPSMKIIDIAKVIRPNSNFRFIGIRPGEKLHEQMIGQEDSLQTFEYQSYYKILPTLNNMHLDPLRIKNGKAVDDSFSYQSNLNADWMSADYLKDWLEINKIEY